MKLPAQQPPGGQAQLPDGNDDYQPDALDDSVTPADLIWILRHPPFPDIHPVTGRAPRVAQCLISLDKGVRDYLVTAVTARHGGVAPSVGLPSALRHTFTR